MAQEKFLADKGAIYHLPSVWDIHFGGKRYNFDIFRILSFLIVPAL